MEVAAQKNSRARMVQPKKHHLNREKDKTSSMFKRIFIIASLNLLKQ
jgi:hypothetical protein